MAFEKTDQERIIQAEARGESEVSFAEEEAFLIKQKIEKRKTKQRKLKMGFGGLSLVIIILLVVLGYSQYKLYLLAKDELNTSSSTSTAPAKNGIEVVKALSRHILLPEGDPQIAEIQDVSKLQDSQAFFKNARNGDIIVVYDSIIIVYRPSNDLIVATGDMSGVGQIKP